VLESKSERGDVNGPYHTAFCSDRGLIDTMLLVTGGTTFIGRAVLRKIANDGGRVRTLIEPSRMSPTLPRGVEVDVALSGLGDTRGIRASMVGVKTLIHLAGARLASDSADPRELDVAAAQNLAEAAADAGVEHIIMLSMLGADRSSAYPLLQAKAHAEDPIRSSGVPSTILRSTILFGEGDAFTTGIAKLAAVSPVLFPIPSDGSTVLQPLWVDDLATCIEWILVDPGKYDQTYEIGGPEYLTYREIVNIVLRQASIMRIPLPMRPPTLRLLARITASILPRSFISRHWTDYLAVNRTTDLNTLPEVFGLAPRRFEDHIGYLSGKNWGWEFLREQLGRHRRE